MTIPEENNITEYSTGSDEEVIFTGPQSSDEEESTTELVTAGPSNRLGTYQKNLILTLETQISKILLVLRKILQKWLILSIFLMRTYLLK